MDDNTTKPDMVIEQYTLILKHELIDNGKPYKIEEPIIARCVLPLTKPHSRDVAPRPYIYNKLVADLVQVIRERIEECEP